MHGPKATLRSSGPQPVTNRPSTIAQEEIALVNSLRNTTEAIGNIISPTNPWWLLAAGINHLIELHTTRADFPRDVAYFRGLGWFFRGEWARIA